AADREAEAASLLFRREEWLEYTRKILAGDSASAVGNRYLDKSIDRPHRHGDPPPDRRGFACVGEQVEKHLFEIALATCDFRNLVRHVEVQFDGAPAHPVFEVGGGCFHRPADVPMPSAPRPVS